MSVGMLTGCPAEEMPGSTGDLLPELLQLHERIRQAMRGIAQALWPAHSVPEGLGELLEKLKGAWRRFQLWKISACRQGAREAWAMVKTRYTKVDPNHMAEVVRMPTPSWTSNLKMFVASCRTLLRRISGFDVAYLVSA